MTRGVLHRPSEPALPSRTIPAWISSEEIFQRAINVTAGLRLTILMLHRAGFRRPRRKNVKYLRSVAKCAISLRHLRRVSKALEVTQIGPGGMTCALPYPWDHAGFRTQVRLHGEGDYRRWRRNPPAGRARRSLRRSHRAGTVSGCSRSSRDCGRRAADAARYRCTCGAGAQGRSQARHSSTPDASASDVAQCEGYLLSGRSGWSRRSCRRQLRRNAKKASMIRCNRK